MKKGVVTTTVANFESYIEDMGDVLVEANSTKHYCLIALEGNLEVMIGMVQTIRSRMGNSVDIGEKFSAPTLWGSTAFIANDLTMVSEDFSSMQTDVVLPMKESMIALQAADVDLSSKNDKVVRTMKILLARV